MRAATTPAPAGDDVPVVGSFAVAAQLRRTTTGTTVRVSVALPEDVKATPATLVPALRALGQQVLVDYRPTGHELPDVDVTHHPADDAAGLLQSVRGAQLLPVPAELVHQAPCPFHPVDAIASRGGGVDHGVRRIQRRQDQRATLPVGATNDHHIYEPPGQKDFQAPAGSFLTSCYGASPRTGSGRS